MDKLLYVKLEAQPSRVVYSASSGVWVAKRGSERVVLAFDPRSRHLSGSRGTKYNDLKQTELMKP